MGNFSAVCLPLWFFDELTFYRRCFKIDVLSIGGKLFLSATKWNNSWMGEAIIGVWSKNLQISRGANGKSRPDYIPLWGS